METVLIEADIRKKLFTASGELTLDMKFSVDRGEMVSVFGPSGVGKTTLLRIISGLTAADEGYLKVDGEVWFDSAARINRPARMRPVGYMFQEYALFPNMTVKENLAFAQPVKDPHHIKQLLELFELDMLKYRRPAVLSGGQQQRVALARALARKPGLLLLDEPLSAIDPEFRSKLQDEILTMHRRYGITTLLVSHDLPEVFKLTGRVIVMEEGRIVKDGNPFDVFAANRTSGKVQLVAEVLKVEMEDIIRVLTLLVGNSLVKVAVCDNPEEQYKPGDRVVLVSKAFNPVIQKIT
ncbi:MAG TPA: ATP-binding cassette domain-containing protein [Bacteroidales bacterium]|nr:ATP-binding cassette domain-containing protein [Bacteroidales bacterium]